jgi:Zn-dependent metalloprotease
MKTIKTLSIIVLTILFTVTLKTHGENNEKEKTSQDSLSKKELARVEIIRRFGQNFSMDDNGIPTRLQGHLFVGSNESDPLEIAYQFFEENKDVFQMENPREELLVRSVRSDDISSTVKFYWAVNGIKVRYGGYFVQIKPNGSIYEVQGQIDPEARKVDTTPSISEERAKEIAINDPLHKGRKPEVVESELIIANFEGGYRLVWSLGIINGGGVGSWYYTIDAKTGEVLKVAEALDY